MSSTRIPSVSPSSLLDRFHAIGEARVHIQGGTDVIVQLQRSLRGTGPGKAITEADIDQAFFHILKRYETRVRTAGLPRQPTDVLHFTEADLTLLSAPATQVTNALDEVNALVGLSHLKQEVASLARLMKDNIRREEMGLKAIRPNLHRVFIGPPGKPCAYCLSSQSKLVRGTGKSTMARLYGRVLQEGKMLSSGDGTFSLCGVIFAC